MPNRIIKESICTSEEIDKLTEKQEVFFYRLMVACDDFGLMDARPAILKARCYPLKSIDIKSIQVMLGALSDVGLLSLYSSDGKPYLHITNWEKHQQIRAKRAKYPLPIDGHAITCNQLISDASNCTRNPIQSNTNPTPSTDVDESFHIFWTSYPRKESKAEALKAWKKAHINGEFDRVMSALEAYKQTDQWIKKIVPHASTWINQKRWKDDLEASAFDGDLL